MDHLLRNRRLGFARTPVSNPFFIDRLVYFLHLRNAHSLRHPRIHEALQMDKIPSDSVHVQDSVVMGDVNAQTIVHHHHFSSPEGATKTAQIAGNQYIATYTPIHTVFWKRTAILGMVIALVAPSYAMFCFMPLSLVGIFSLVFQTDIGVQQAGHPEGKTVMNAFLLQIVAFIVIIARFSAV